jgi:FtsP/CotA-like multicopper oxidase with cupredoxin domain
MSRKTVLALIIMLFVGVLAGSVNIHVSKASTVRNFTLYGHFNDGWGFTADNITKPGPPITVDQGDVVNLTLISVDGITHQFYVDYNGDHSLDDAEPHQSFSGSTPVHFNFTASLNGTFTYYCSIHPSIMFGTFIVNFVVPEFPSAPILMLFMAATLIAVVVYKRKYR